MIITNVSIRTSNPDLVDFMYPSYTRLSEYSPFVSGGVIYDGDPKYLQSFRDSGTPYIYVKGTPEYDLTVPENLIEFVYNKHDKKTPKGVLEYVKSLDMKKASDVNELNDIAKLVWVTGKCSIEDSNEKVFEKLYDTLATGAVYDNILTFCKLSEEINKDKVFYRIKSFIEKSQNIEEQKNAWLKAKLKNFDSSRGKNIKKSLLGYLYSPAESDDIKMMKLLESLTKMY